MADKKQRDDVFLTDLSKSREHLLALIENTNDIILSIDTEYNILTINSGAKAAFGQILDVEISPGINILELLPDVLKNLWKERYDRALRGERFLIEDQFVDEKKEYFSEVAFNPILKDGKVTGVTVFSRDITRYKLIERELRQKEENLHVTLQSIGDAVIATDINGAVVRMNQVAEKLTGWLFIEAEGRPLSEVFHVIHARTRERIENPVEKVLATGEVVGLASHTILVSKNGVERHIADSGAPIRSEQGATRGVVLVFRDVTEENALQEQLRQSQKMDAIGQLAGGIAHDFNNMIAGIINAAELLEPFIAKEGKPKRFLQIIIEAGQSAADLTNKLLTFARHQSVASKNVDVHEALTQAISLVENTIDKRIRIISNLVATESRMIGDLSQLQSLFLNLAINGAQAMEAGGTLSFETTSTYLDEKFCETSTFDLQSGDYIEINIRDTGHGINSENLERIFEPFFTTKEAGQGTGLGLSVVFGTVKQHKGAIKVYSEAGQGSCFQVLLPLSHQLKDSQNEKRQIKQGQGCILIVEDEPHMRTTAQQLLENFGYHVIVCNHGGEAVKVFTESYNEIDLVLLDMIMPIMNGKDCFYELKKIQPDVKVILTSGFTEEAELKQLKKDGLFDFVAKPYNSIELSHLLAKAVAP